MTSAREKLDEANVAIAMAVQILTAVRPTLEEFMVEAERMDNFGPLLAPLALPLAGAGGGPGHPRAHLPGRPRFCPRTRDHPCRRGRRALQGAAMTDGTAIEWTHRPGTRGETWNPVVGCDIVSPGCIRCYAMKMAARIERMGTAPHYAGTTKPTKAGPVWTGKIALAPEKTLLAPLRWTKPRTVFVNSMGDLFHEAIPDETIDRIFAVMALAPQHTFIVLTKRPARMRRYFTATPGRQHSIAAAQVQWPDPLPHPGRWPHLPLPNVWLGVSAEDQRRADQRIPYLLATPAAVRFVSAEPVLGPIDFTAVNVKRRRRLDALNRYVAIYLGDGHWDNRPTTAAGIDWIIVGGESGTASRPMHPAWARSIRDQCAAAGTAFFFKQWGGLRTKSGGRLLDGREHSEFPEQR